VGAVIGAALLYALTFLVRGNRKLRRFLRLTIASVFALGAIVFTVALTPVISASKGTISDGADYVIVLGAGVNGVTPSMTLSDRLRAAYAYMEEHPGSIAVLSGAQGDGEDISESECMRVWLESAGVSGQRLITEDKSTSTVENIRFSVALIPDGATIALISSEYHLYRAGKTAYEEGVENIALVPANMSRNDVKVNYFIREGLICIHDWLFGNTDA
jgi:uncharacterized SAM-binding protein YcdF (DUF218 family)